MMNLSDDEVDSIDPMKQARSTRLQKSTAARKQRKRVKEVLSIKIDREERLVEAKLKKELL